MSRTVRTLAFAVASAALLSGCGEEEPPVIDVGTRITTAADALECPDGAEVETRSVSAGTRPGREDALAAVQAWAKRMRKSSDIPADGYQVSIEEVGTVLFTHETEARAEIAVIATRTEDKNGDLGWVVQSWARCRPGA
jgi:hypothetical protein